MGSPQNFILKRNLYENCRVRGQDGELMFYCSSKRARWYITRGLADIITEEPLEIKLNFKTNGPGNAGDAFYMQHRKNMCVVCGSDDRLTRHHVVPYAFRRFLPAEVKDHSYHDVLLLCIDCHEKYEHHALSLKRKLSEEYGVPVDGIFDARLANDMRRVKGYARVLLEHNTLIPEERKTYLLDFIKKTFNTDNPDLDSISKMEFEWDVKTQAEVIVSQLTDVRSFLRLWRGHFVETMQPKFMPEHWDIERGSR